MKKLFRLLFKRTPKVTQVIYFKGEFYNLFQRYEDFLGKNKGITVVSTTMCQLHKSYDTKEDYLLIVTYKAI